MAMCKAGLAAFSRNPVTSNSRDVIYFNMGSTYLYNENLPAAIEQFKNCIHVNPGEHDCRKQLRLAQGMLANQ